MRNLLIWVAVTLCSSLTLNAQINFTANTVVPAYNGNFNYGVNAGAASTWSTNSMADIMAGNPIKGINGLNARSFRTLFPPSFVSQWGYDLFKTEYEYYYNLGLHEFVVMLEGAPIASEQDNVYYDKNNQVAGSNACGIKSKMFKDIYLPIWDGGLNGTPINDNNPYAKYVYNMVTRYKKYIRFWEVVNEPDFSFSAAAQAKRGATDNWWENTPDPCALLNLRAPIFQYIRTMRIAYEVIKYVDPTAYVGSGGLSFPSFLDGLCRYTDNPNGGTVTSDYPLKGGAYFDVLSFHSYPMVYMGIWSNVIGGMLYERHSDKGILEFMRVKNDFDSVLKVAGYNGTTYPKKLVICTETNLPSKQISDLVGSDVAQTNYLIKVLVESQKTGIIQNYPYVGGDVVPAASASNAYDVMGLYECLTNKGPDNGGAGWNQKMKPAGIGFKTTATLLYERKYDAARTAAMNLPATLGGGAFRDDIGRYTYVLWSKTKTDNSEVSPATYAFPAAMNVAPEMERRLWDWGKTNTTDIVQASSVALNGAPIFLSESFTLLPVDETPRPPVPVEKEYSAVTVYPNPAAAKASIGFTLKEKARINVDIYNAEGQFITKAVADRALTAGSYTIPLPVQQLVSGVYYCHFKTEKSVEIKKLIITR
jgi:hypothetical protein